MPTATLTHPASAEDWEKLLAFSRLACPQADSATRLRHHRERPDCDPEQHPMLVDDDGSVVAAASVLHRRHYFGEGEIEVAELAFLGVHPDRRLQGHGKRLLAHCLDEARSRGAAYVYTYGIPRFFERHGFVHGAPAHDHACLRMSRAVLEPVLSPYRVRPLQASDRALLEELYDQANCKTTMAEVRSPEYWAYRLGQTRQGGFGWWVAVDENNQPHGYVWADLERACLREVVVGDDEASRAIMQWMRWELAERKLNEFTAQVPQDQPFARLAHRLGAQLSHPTALYPGNWGAQLRVLRFEPLMEALRPQLEGRLRSSRYALLHDLQVTLRMGDESVSLRWFRDTLQVAPGSVGREIMLPAACWTALLTGYRSVDDYPALAVDEAERHLLRTLFEGPAPFMWHLDHLESFDGATSLSLG